MPWMPIATSGITFGLSLSAGVTLVGSTLTCTNAVPLACSVGFDVSRQLRITNQSWNYAGVGGAHDYWSWNDEVNTQANGDGTQASWLPAVFAATIDAADSLNFRVAGDPATHRSFAFLVEVFIGSTIPPIDDAGSGTRCRAAVNQRDRAFFMRMYRSETRGFVVDWNAAIGTSRTITSVTWRIDQNFAISMASPNITGRTTSIILTAQQAGQAAVKCVVTLDNGETYAQMAVVEVLDGRTLFGDEGTYVSGPQVLSYP